MSSLIFHTESKLAVVATDTLAMSLDQNIPYNFMTKAYILPHLRLIVCGTGLGSFGIQWFTQINENLVVADIDNLNYHTPDALNKLWSSFKSAHKEIEKTTSTMYHFGFSESDECIHSYVYRSTNNFKSEHIVYGLGYKPECNPPDQYKFPEDIIKMMEQQKEIQSTKPISERLGIGGEIQMIVLNENGFNVSIIHKFDDYDSDKNIIYSKFK